MIHPPASSTTVSSSDPIIGKAATSWRVAGLLAAYSIGFALTYQIASLWGGSYFYSLWYPAAGVRLAFLWRYGAGWTLGIAAAELLVQTCAGIVIPGDPHFVDQALGVMRCPVFYGAAVALVRWIERHGVSDLTMAPMPFGLVAVLAPTITAFLSGAWEWVRPGAAHQMLTQPPVTTIAALLVGDLLGVLLVAPALLWLGAEDRSRRFGISILSSWPRLLEVGLTFGLGWLLATLLVGVNPDLSMMPVLLTTSWIGLRCGRGGAWVAIILSSLIVLPWSVFVGSTATRLALHMGLAATAISGYLAGCFADAQQRARQDIARRDRMLFQAERLKTLRAMSVAVIHEISQPLSTLAIESRHLADIGADPVNHDVEIAESAALIARKADTLSTMIRRLRRFGGRSVDEPSLLSLGVLASEAVKLVAEEARAKHCPLHLTLPDDDLLVMGQEIELTQALLNIVRNAVAASPGYPIKIELSAQGTNAILSVSNMAARPGHDHRGMGVGSLVARTIIEAHGGELIRRDRADATVIHAIHLPLMEAQHE